MIAFDLFCIVFIGLLAKVAVLRSGLLKGFLLLPLVYLIKGQVTSQGLSITN